MQQGSPVSVNNQESIRTFMRRFLAMIFLFLYFYNIVGYLAIFSVTQARIRSDIKKTMKATVPETDLRTFSFHTPSLAESGYPLHWIDDHEFRYEGKLYDIVRSYVRNDTTHFVCINDEQEERLFEHLDSHVQREMGRSGHASKFDSFKDVFKDSLTRCFALTVHPEVNRVPLAMTLDSYSPIEPEVPALPPRLLS